MHKELFRFLGRVVFVTRTKNNSENTGAIGFGNVTLEFEIMAHRRNTRYILWLAHMGDPIASVSVHGRNRPESKQTVVSQSMN